VLKHSDVVADHSDEAMGYTKVNSQTVCLLPDAAFAWGCFGSIAAIREKRLRAALTHGGRSHKCSVPEIRGTYLWFSPHDTANPSRAPSVGRVDSKACRPQRLNVKTVIKWRSRTTTQDAQMGDIECYHPAPPCNPFPTFSIAISYPQEPCTRSPQGINSLPVAANSATGFGDPDKLGAAAPHDCRRFFCVRSLVPWRLCAGDLRVCRVPSSRFANLRTAATHCLATVRGGSNLTWSLMHDHHTSVQDPRIRSPPPNPCGHPIPNLLPDRQPNPRRTRQPRGVP